METNVLTNTKELDKEALLKKVIEVMAKEKKQDYIAIAKKLAKSNLEKQINKIARAEKSNVRVKIIAEPYSTISLASYIRAIADYFKKKDINVYNELALLTSGKINTMHPLYLVGIEKGNDKEKKKKKAHITKMFSIGANDFYGRNLIKEILEFQIPDGGRHFSSLNPNIPIFLKVLLHFDIPLHSKLKKVLTSDEDLFAYVNTLNMLFQALNKRNALTNKHVYYLPVQFKKEIIEQQYQKYQLSFKDIQTLLQFSPEEVLQYKQFVQNVKAFIKQLEEEENKKTKKGETEQGTKKTKKKTKKKTRKRIKLHTIKYEDAPNTFISFKYLKADKPSISHKNEHIEKTFNLRLDIDTAHNDAIAQGLIDIAGLRYKWPELLPKNLELSIEEKTITLKNQGAPRMTVFTGRGYHLYYYINEPYLNTEAKLYNLHAKALAYYLDNKVFPSIEKHIKTKALATLFLLYKAIIFTSPFNPQAVLQETLKQGIKETLRELITQYFPAVVIKENKLFTEGITSKMFELLGIFLKEDKKIIDKNNNKDENKEEEEIEAQYERYLRRQAAREIYEEEKLEEFLSNFIKQVIIQAGVPSYWEKILTLFIQGVLESFEKGKIKNLNISFEEAKEIFEEKILHSANNDGKGLRILTIDKQALNLERIVRAPFSIHPVANTVVMPFYFSPRSKMYRTSGMYRLVQFYVENNLDDIRLIKQTLKTLKQHDETLAKRIEKLARKALTTHQHNEIEKINEIYNLQPHNISVANSIKNYIKNSVKNPLLTMLLHIYTGETEIPLYDFDYLLDAEDKYELNKFIKAVIKCLVKLNLYTEGLRQSTILAIAGFMRQNMFPYKAAYEVIKRIIQLSTEEANEAEIKKRFDALKYTYRKSPFEVKGLNTLIENAPFPEYKIIYKKFYYCLIRAIPSFVHALYLLYYLFKHNIPENVVFLQEEIRKITGFQKAQHFGYKARAKLESWGILERKQVVIYDHIKGKKIARTGYIFHKLAYLRTLYILSLFAAHQINRTNNNYNIIANPEKTAKEVYELLKKNDILAQKEENKILADELAKHVYNITTFISRMYKTNDKRGIKVFVQIIKYFTLLIKKRYHNRNEAYRIQRQHRGNNIITLHYVYKYYYAPRISFSNSNKTIETLYKMFLYTIKGAAAIKMLEAIRKIFFNMRIDSSEAHLNKASPPSFLNLSLNTN